MPLVVGAQGATDAWRHGEGGRIDVAHRLVEAAHFFRREDTIPVVADILEAVVEAAGVVAGFVFIAPRRGALQQFQLLDAELDVGEEVGAVVHIIGEGTDEIGGGTLRLQGLVADGAFAAAIVALDIPAVTVIRIGGQVSGAAIGAGGQGALGFGGVIGVIGVNIKTLPVGDRRLVGCIRRIERRILRLALIAVNWVLPQDFAAEDAVELAGIEAGRAAEAVRGAAALFGEAVAVIQRITVVALLELEIDDTGQRIGTVDGRGRTGQHFDLVDHAKRDVGDVGEVRRTVERHRIIGDATAIDHDERVIGAEAAQIHLLSAGRKVGGVVILLRLGVAAVGGDGLQHVRHAGITAGTDLVGIDHGDRCRAFFLSAGDARAENDDSLRLIGYRGRRGILCTGHAMKAVEATSGKQCQLAETAESHIRPGFKHGQLLILRNAVRGCKWDKFANIVSSCTIFAET